MLIISDTDINKLVTQFIASIMRRVTIALSIHNQPTELYDGQDYHEISGTGFATVWFEYDSTRHCEQKIETSIRTGVSRLLFEVTLIWYR